MPEPKAMNLRFPDPEQRAAIAAAAAQEGVSLQEYILSAAYARATAVEQHFLDGFKESMARSAAAFTAEPSSTDPTAEQRAAEQHALAEFAQQERGRAA
ncbi:type II toxin -antitoxin system TacA 1-like antitoxin [Streptomyces sp. OZ13]|uniref:type II toxin -antitoxin system TacA 1-like antitoxin n=1 Tax=Streptomyces sp. OZ13 TaxID=3452210 RepID=UPI003F8BA847